MCKLSCGTCNIDKTEGAFRANSNECKKCAKERVDKGDKLSTAPKNKLKMTEEKKAEVIRLFKDGLLVKEVAEKVNISNTTVTRFLTQYLAKK